MLTCWSITSLSNDLSINFGQTGRLPCIIESLAMVYFVNHPRKINRRGSVMQEVCLHSCGTRVQRVCSVYAYYMY